MLNPNLSDKRIAKIKNKKKNNRITNMIKSDTCIKRGVTRKYVQKEII